MRHCVYMKKKKHIVVKENLFSYHGKNMWIYKKTIKLSTYCLINKLKRSIGLEVLPNPPNPHAPNSNRLQVSFKYTDLIHEANTMLLWNCNQLRKALTNSQNATRSGFDAVAMIRSFGSISCFMPSIFVSSPVISSKVFFSATFRIKCA